MEHDKWEYIKNIINVEDMSDIIDYLHRKKGWSYHAASNTCHLYKNYLFLVAKYKKNIPPSYEINEAWRAHILTDLENYQKICKEIYGDYYNELSPYKFFYLNGYFISKRDEENFENITVDLFLKEFKQHPNNLNSRDIWSWIIGKVSGVFKHGINKMIFPVAIPFTIIMYAGNIVHHNQVLASTAENLQRQSAKISHQFENREKICNYTLHDKKNPNYLNQLYDFNKMLDKSLDDLIAMYHYAYQRKLISSALFQELGKFVTKYADLFGKYQPYICNAPIQNDELEKQERIDINEKIQQSEKNLRKNFFGLELGSANIIYTPEGPALMH